MRITSPALPRLKAGILAFAAVAGLVAAAPAMAQIKIGVTISSTGPAASLGIPEKNAIALLPREIGGKKVDYIILDDASDTNTTVTNTRKLIAEEKVDAIIGSTTTPNSLAMVDVVAEGKNTGLQAWQCRRSNAHGESLLRFSGFPLCGFIVGGNCSGKVEDDYGKVNMTLPAPALDANRCRCRQLCSVREAAAFTIRS